MDSKKEIIIDAEEWTDCDDFFILDVGGFIPDKVKEVLLEW